MATVPLSRSDSASLTSSDREVSLFAWGTALLRERWRVVRWMVLGGAIAAAAVAFRPPLYSASASFVPQANENARSSLASLAGQFGLNVASGDQSFSPEFYVALLRSRVLLDPIVRDSFVVAEMGGERRAYVDLFNIDGASAARRYQLGRRDLAQRVRVGASRTTSVVNVAVTTPWPSVSQAIVSALVDSVTAFNQRARQGQAGAERRFVEQRLAEARADLRQAEDRLEQFLRSNRQYLNSPQLAFERDRLQREMMLRQQVFTSLTDAHEDVRIRELRNTPVVTLVEPPEVSATPEPRGRARAVFVGLIIGALIGAAFAIAHGSVLRRRRMGDTEAEEFLATARDVKGRILRPVTRLRGRR